MRPFEVWLNAAQVITDKIRKKAIAMNKETEPMWTPSNNIGGEVPITVDAVGKVAVKKAVEETGLGTAKNLSLKSDAAISPLVRDVKFIDEIKILLIQQTRTRPRARVLTTTT
jgi:hypothetical protein